MYEESDKYHTHRMYHFIESNKVYYIHNHKNKNDGKDHDINDDDIIYSLLHCVYIYNYLHYEIYNNITVA